MRTPYEEAYRVYQTEPCARPFDEDLLAHLLTGFVYSTPDFFVMGRPVVSSAISAFIMNPWHRFKKEECDCWHVYLCAGNMAKAWGVLPWELPLISFERKNEARCYQLDSLRRLSGIPLH